MKTWKFISSGVRRVNGPHLLLTAAVAAIALLVPSAAQAGGTCAGDAPTCGYSKCATPASGAPAALWGELKPVDVGVLPANRDTSDFNEFVNPYTVQFPFWTSLDIEGTRLLTSLHRGIQVWSIADPENPQLLNTLDGYFTFRQWATGELKSILRDIDAPPGKPELFAVAGEGGTGIAIFHQDPGSAPKLLYQDAKRDAPDVYSTTLSNGRDYAFLAVIASSNSRQPGVHVYDMTETQKFSNACLDSAEGCAGVYKGRVSSNTKAARHVAGVGDYVVASFGASRGLEIHNVSNPSAPQLKLTGLDSQPVYGVAMWKNGSKYYLGLKTSHFVAGVGSIFEGQIFDVSCITGAGVCSLGSPLSSMQMDKSQVDDFWVTHSKSLSTDFLYFGASNSCNSGQAQAEWLLDVSNPSNPRDITPAPAIVGGQLTGYWGWYYRGNPTGYNYVQPRVGKFSGEYFYRAAYSILDIHQRTGGLPPAADFTWASTEPDGKVYIGSAVNFTDASAGTIGSRSWAFQGGFPSTSIETNPAGVTFASAGSKEVSLFVQNANGSDTAIQSVPVLDPAPAVASVTANPSPATECQDIRFTANGVTGKPTLTISWDVKNSSGISVLPQPGGNVNPFVWSVPDGVTGNFTATVNVTGIGSPASKSALVTVESLGDLTDISTLAPTTDAFVANLVQFTAPAHSNATKWTWDFGDGNTTCPLGWTTLAAGAGCQTTDPSQGKTPQHTYANVGTYQATVTIASCKGSSTSAAKSVVILQTEPLVAHFQATGIFCGGIACSANLNQAITFDDSSTGAQTWDYDWDGDGTYESSGNTSPVTTHAYTSSGLKTPKLRVHRGTEVDVYAHSPSINISGGTTPPNKSISISGPSSGQVGASLSYSATASGCTPLSTWSWTASSGGTVTGTGNAVTVSWSTAGSKSLGVTNGGCSGTTGTKFVTISEPGGGGGGGGGSELGATYNFSPQNPKAGEAVSFDASASTGGPEFFSWDYGDGSTGSGKNASHSFSKAGSYQVKLEVGKFGPCAFGFCTDSVTKLVTVGGGAEVLDAEFEADAECVNQFGIRRCTVESGQEVSFTALTQGGSSYEWAFGDGGVASGKNVSHTWSAPGDFTVSLTVTKGQASDTASQQFHVDGAPVKQVQPVVVPWIAQADPDKALNQTSDLDVYNPGDAPLQVRMTFRKRGLPEPDPPQVTRTVAPGSTLHVPDAMNELFHRGNTSGFLFVEPIEGASQPVVTTFNRTFRPDGQSYGQVVPGFPLSNLQEAAGGGTQVLHLVGLNDNSDRQAYFGISNPSDQPLIYNLRFYDAQGELLGGTQEDQSISRFGQKQYQVENIREDFGVENLDDYRIEIVVADGSPQPFVYGQNLRLVSRDPSFLRVGRTDLGEVFLVGALNTPGNNDSFFQSDVVLGNTGGSAAVCDLTFTPTGFRSEPTTPIHETVPPKSSVRLSNVVGQWDVGNSVGVLRIACDGAGGVFPVVQGESYDVSRPLEVYGQFMPALSTDLAAEPGRPHSLVGLRQDAENRTTLWIYNPGDEVARYALHYFDEAGTEVGSETDVRLGQGKFRQINPGFIPEGIDGGFVVRVEVLEGKLLTAAQVVNSANDPAYIVGQ